MILGSFAAWRRRRTEQQAYRWVARIVEDRDRHAEGLRDWVGVDQARADIYNAAYRAFRDAGPPAEKLFGTVRERENWAPPPVLVPARAKLGLAMGLVLGLLGAGLVLGLTLMHRSDDRAPLGASARSASVIAAGVGEIRRVTLSDGSHIVLDTGSVLRLAFTTTERRVRLDRGRVRFEVAHDPNWPFIVSAGGGTITARGTVFDVTFDRTVQVHLLSGAIDVGYPEPPHRPALPVQHLTAGQQVRYGPAMAEVPETPAHGQRDDDQWVTGMRTFDDVPVATIIEEANRYATARIVLTDPDQGKRRTFLDVDLRDTREIARNLAIFLGLVVDESRPDILLLRSPRSQKSAER